MALDRSRAFADLLRGYRRAARLTQEELAARAGLSARALRKLESGASRVPRRDTISLLAVALALAPEDRARLEATARQQRPSLLADAPRTLTGDAPAPQAAPPLNPPPINNVPTPLTPLIGREREEAAAVHLLRRDDVRLLTLTGPPGIGKTRLALRVATDLLDDFPDGVCLVELAPITDPSAILPTVLRALEVRQTDGVSHPPLADLIDHLHTRRLLLVLDNFEQVATAATQVAELLRACPGLKVLATSRIPLRVQGEHQLAVPPLALPDLAALPPAADLLKYAAVALFVHRAREVVPTFELTPERARAVAAICHRLDGLPLAIELAAPWIRLMSPVTLLERLAQRLSLLTDGSNDLPSRQRTARRAIDWGHDLLAPAERVIFRRLGVFVGGWMLDAAEAVCGEPAPASGESDESTKVPTVRPDGARMPPVLPALAALVDSSLVDRQDHSADGEVRFRLLELVREYALEQLEASGEAERARERHARYYLDLAHQAGLVGLGGADMESWVVQLAREEGNLRAAFAWATRHDIPTGLRAAGDFWDYWQVSGQAGEGQRWLEEFLRLDTDAGCPSTPLARATALNAAGTLAYRLGRYARAAAHYEEALTLARSLGHLRLIAATLNNLGNNDMDQGEFARARERFEECLALRREAARKLDAAVAADHAGHLDASAVDALWHDLGVAARAEEIGDRAAMLTEVVRWNTQALAAVLGNLGRLAMALGEYARAEHLIEQAGAQFAASGRSRHVIQTRVIQGTIAAQRGDYARAHALLEPAATHMLEVGDRDYLATALNALGWCAREEGDGAQALALHRESLALRRAIGDQSGVAECLDGLAMVRATAGAPESAAQLLAAAAALRDALHAPLFPADRAIVDRVTAELRAVLGEATFASLWTEARATPLEHILAAEVGSAVHK